MWARSTQKGIKFQILVKRNSSPRASIFIESNMGKFLSFGSLTLLIKVFVTILTKVMSCISKSFKGSLQNHQFTMLGRCMAPVVRCSWLVIGHIEMKQVFNLSCNDVWTCTLGRARIKIVLTEIPLKELKSTLHIAPNLQNFWERNPMLTSAPDFKAEWFNCDEIWELRR